MQNCIFHLHFFYVTVSALATSRWWLHYLKYLKIRFHHKMLLETNVFKYQSNYEIKGFPSRFVLASLTLPQLNYINLITISYIKMAIFLFAFASGSYFSSYSFQTFLCHLITASWSYFPATAVKLSLFHFSYLIFSLPEEKCTSD